MGFVTKIVLLLVLVAVVTPRTIKTLVDECKKSVPMSAEQEKSFLELRFPPEEKATHCLFNCIGEMLQLFDSKSGANLKNIRVLLMGSDSSEDLTEDHRKCVLEAEKRVDGEEECLMAYRVYKCFEEDFFAIMKKETETMATTTECE
uniref:Putative odorant-binding protein 56a n=1 Tax=Culex tarsalis TaxID=7177 RepID=A0A1Q3FSY8_CULTA